ncbi:glycosyltransferase-like protein gnt13 isoform X2 [Drosophila willistoni]|uniref:glycosyltransferase-like protein gnt13 isoform X2 n=1 Tax=Drosophila willistoni TaxID=7260 RepID=UPI000C26CFF5|nr:glycosyltransferase-like protein gnt13 isoform X2 [Drosophila willistoni]
MASKSDLNDSDQDTNNNIDNNNDTTTNVDVEDNSDVNADKDNIQETTVENNIDYNENKNDIIDNKEKDTKIDLEDNDNNKSENNITNDTHVENGNQKDVEQKDGDKERPISHTSAKRKRVEMDDEEPSTSEAPIKIFKVSEDTKYYIFENNKRNNDQEEGANPDVVDVVKDENEINKY